MIGLKAQSISALEDHTIYLGGFLGEAASGIDDEVFEFLSSKSNDTCTYDLVCEINPSKLSKEVQGLDLLETFCFLDFIIIRKLTDISDTGEDLFIFEEHCRKFGISLIVLDLNLDTSTDNGKELLERYWAIYEMCRDFKSGSNTFPEEI